MESKELVTKKCSTCGEEKVLSDFHRNKRSKDGFQNMCKKCREKYNKVNGRKYREQPQFVGIYTLIITGLDNMPYWYIGSSKSVPLRFSNHQSMLKYNKHSNPNLQKIYNEIRHSKGENYAESSLKIKELLDLDRFFINARNNKSWRLRAESMAIDIAFNALKNQGLDPKAHILNDTMPISKKKIDWRIFENMSNRPFILDGMSNIR